MLLRLASVKVTAFFFLVYSYVDVTVLMRSVLKFEHHNCCSWLYLKLFQKISLLTQKVYVYHTNFHSTSNWHIYIM